MTFQATRSAQRLFLSFAALIAAAAYHPAAANVCVSCTGPDASYACAIDGASMSDDDPRYKLLCITELAKSGGHQSCAVSRAVTAPCPGAVKTIAAPGVEIPAPAFTGPVVISPPASADPPRAQNAAPPPPAEAPHETVTTVPKTSQPPKTVQQAVEEGASSAGESLEKTGEGAKDIAKSAGGMMEKAGQAVGDAAKSTWKCLSTFFGDC